MEHHHHHVHEDANENELQALLQFMLNHNEHHTEELEKLYKKLEVTNKESADKVKQAIEDFKNGNAKLSSALDKMKEG